MKKISNARELLIAEGRRTLGEVGYANLDIKKVTAACGMATGTFYNYFVGKREFVLAIVARERNRKQGEIDQVLASELPLRDTLERMTVIFEDYRNEIYAVFLQLSPNSQESAEIMADIALYIRAISQRILGRAGTSVSFAQGVKAEDVVAYVTQYIVGVATTGSMGFHEFIVCLAVLLDDGTLLSAKTDGQPLKESFATDRLIISRMADDAGFYRRMFEAVIDDTGLIIWEYDIANRRILISDDEYARYDYQGFGLSKIIDNAPRALAAYIVDEYVDAFLDMYRQIEEGVPKTSCEVWYKFKTSQESRCIRFSCTTFFDDEGIPVAASVIGQDITSQKSSELHYMQALKELARAHPRSLGSTHLNLTKNLVGGRDNPFGFVFMKQQTGTVDDFFVQFAETIDDDAVREWFLADFDRVKLLEGFEKGNIEITFEYPVVCDDRGRHWREGLLYLIQNPLTGDVEGITYAIDIDERKYDDMVARTLSREVFGFMIMLDIRTGMIIYGGDTAYVPTEEYRNTDYTTAMEAALRAMMPPDELDAAIEVHSIGNICAHLEKQHVYEVTLVTKDACCLRWRFSYANEARDIVLITRDDITAATHEEQERVRELERERRAHQHTEALLQSILDSAPAAMFWKDINRRFEGANRAFLDFYSFDSLDAILGKTDEDMGWHPDPDPYRDDERQVIAKGVHTRRVPGECMSHGELRHIVASKSPRYEDGKIVGLVGNFEDVTREFEYAAEITALNAELKDALANAEQASAAEQMFLSNMSHDIRTPLNGIIGFTNLALQTDDIKMRQTYLEKIDVSGKLMLDLVNDVLDLSKIESGKMDLRPEAFESAELFNNVVDAVRFSAEEHGIILEATIDEAYPRFVLADRLRCQQISLNLLSNSIKYTPDGGRVVFEIVVLAEPVEDCNTLIVVADTGIGMSAEFQKRMFEPFSQEHQSRMYGTQGTGLGLSIVKKTVDLMGGHIDVRSELGKGTTFSVYLPLEKVDADRASQANQSTGEDDIAGKRFLLCEDNQLNAEIAMTILRERGDAEVEHVHDGQEGLSRFEAVAPGYYDAILMDIRMPLMDGLEATRAIRMLDRPDANTIPIMAMTADAFVEDARNCRAAGMNEYISKPIDPKKLIAKLARLCAGEG